MSAALPTTAIQYRAKQSAGNLLFSGLGKGLRLVHDGAAQVTLEGLHELVVQVGQLLLEQLPHHGRQLALQLLLLGLPHTCLKVASLLLVACTQFHISLSQCEAWFEGLQLLRLSHACIKVASLLLAVCTQNCVRVIQYESDVLSRVGEVFLLL